MSQRSAPARPLTGALAGVISGVISMFLLLALAQTSLALALAAALVVAGAGGAVAAPMLRRSPTGANLAGLFCLAGVALFSLPVLLSEAGSALSGTQFLLFGAALAFVCAMGGQFTAR